MIFFLMSCSFFMDGNGAGIPLHLAVKEGNVDNMKTILDGGADINAKDEYGKTALHIAIKTKNKEAAKRLIEAGASVDAIDFWKQSILHYAAELGDIEIIKLILERDTTLIDWKNIWSDTALHIALRSKNIEVAKQLIDNGADFKSKDIDEKTILHYAAKRGDVDIIRLLLDSGADIDDQDKERKTALMLALESKNIEAAQYLLSEKANINLEDDMNQSALYYAARFGDVNIIKSIIEIDPSIKFWSDRFNRRLLHIAIMFGNSELSEYLISFDSRDKFGNTAFHYAAEIGNIKIIKLLFCRSIKTIDTKNNNGYTPLKLAFINAQKEVIKFLIKKGADITIISDNNSKSALHYAAEIGDPEIIKLILEKCDKLDKDAILTKDDNRTALHLAIARHNIEAAKCLVKEGANVGLIDVFDNNSLHLAVELDDAEIIELILEKDYTLINSTNDNLKTPLYLALREGNKKAAKCLIEKGAFEYINDKMTIFSLAVRLEDVELVRLILERDSSLIYERIPDELLENFKEEVVVMEYINRKKLYDEIKCGNKEAANCLIEKGVNVNLTDNTSRTTLHYAAEIGDVDIIRLILEKDYTLIDCQTEWGVTALHIAIKHDNKEAIEYLKKQGAIE